MVHTHNEDPSFASTRKLTNLPIASRHGQLSSKVIATLGLTLRYIRVRLIVRNLLVAQLLRGVVVALWGSRIIEGLLLSGLVILGPIRVVADRRGSRMTVSYGRRESGLGGRRGTTRHASVIESWLSKGWLPYAVARVDGGEPCNARCVAAVLGHRWAARVIATAWRTQWRILAAHRARRIGQRVGGIVPLLSAGADEQECTQADQADDSHATDSASDHRGNRKPGTPLIVRICGRRTGPNYILGCY